MIAVRAAFRERSGVGSFTPLLYPEPDDHRTNLPVGVRTQRAAHRPPEAMNRRMMSGIPTTVVR